MLWIICSLYYIGLKSIGVVRKIRNTIFFRYYGIMHGYTSHCVQVNIGRMTINRVRNFVQCDVYACLFISRANSTHIIYNTFIDTFYYIFNYTLTLCYIQRIIERSNEKTILYRWHYANQVFLIIIIFINDNNRKKKKMQGTCVVCYPTTKFNRFVWYHISADLSYIIVIVFSFVTYT